MTDRSQTDIFVANEPPFECREITSGSLSDACFQSDVGEGEGTAEENAYYGSVVETHAAVSLWTPLKKVQAKFMIYLH